MVIYQSFHTIGLKVEVVPLLDSTHLDEADENLFEKEAEICADDPENHVAIDYDEWQCQTCHEGYPTLDEWKSFKCKTNLVGNGLHTFTIGELKSTENRFNIQGGLDDREWQREELESVSFSILSRYLTLIQ
jgi:hypothetical protein